MGRIINDYTIFRRIIIPALLGVVWLRITALRAFASGAFALLGCFSEWPNRLLWNSDDFLDLRDQSVARIGSPIDNFFLAPVL
jgi:hypothetical protein